MHSLSVRKVFDQFTTLPLSIHKLLPILIPFIRKAVFSFSTQGLLESLF